MSMEDEGTSPAKRPLVESVRDWVTVLLSVVMLVYLALAIAKLWRVRNHHGSWDDDPRLN
jgi:hypothetical protein